MYRPSGGTDTQLCCFVALVVPPSTYTFDSSRFTAFYEPVPRSQPV